jgi:hypothetical protein
MRAIRTVVRSDDLDWPDGTETTVVTRVGDTLGTSVGVPVGSSVGTGTADAGSPRAGEGVVVGTTVGDHDGRGVGVRVGTTVVAEVGWLSDLTVWRHAAATSPATTTTPTVPGIVWFAPLSG